METEIAKYPVAGIEDGELTGDSDDSYTPLQRPESNLVVHKLVPMAANTSKMDDAEDEDTPLESELSSDDSSGRDEGVNRLIHSDEKRTMKKYKKGQIAKLRVKRITCTQNERPKKYNVWSESLQEEALMENMRDFDVSKVIKSDRSVESYDFSLKYRLNGENRLKRRLDSPKDDHSSGDECSPNQKRSRHDCRSVKERLGKKTSFSAPRHILDLDVDEDAKIEIVARDIANKLCEEKDDLMLRVVEVLSVKVAIELFKRTQRIEDDGGMMIMNGRRRRTPGGVYLFLLKNDDKIPDESKRAIFHEEVRKSNMEKKVIQACRRDQKVEELKRRLNIKNKELKPLPSYSDMLTEMSHLSSTANGTLSNPPPSPVMNSGRENSPEYSSHEINHVSDCIPAKINASNVNDASDESLVAYDDDVLDMNYDDMDMF